MEVIMMDHNSIMVPGVDGPVRVDGWNEGKAREVEAEVVEEQGWEDAWRIGGRGTGATRRERRIDRVHVGKALKQLVKECWTTPVGHSDHQAVVVRLAPEAPHEVRWRVPEAFWRSWEK
jgi:hypothetical protein